MTVKVTISNDDSGRDVLVKTIDHHKDGRHTMTADSLTLKPGESRSFYIHLLRDLTVEEVNPTGG